MGAAVAMSIIPSAVPSGMLVRTLLLPPIRQVGIMSTDTAETACFLRIGPLVMKNAGITMFTRSRVLSRCSEMVQLYTGDLAIGKQSAKANTRYHTKAQRSINDLMTLISGMDQKSPIDYLIPQITGILRATECILFDALRVVRNIYVLKCKLLVWR